MSNRLAITKGEKQKVDFKLRAPNRKSDRDRDSTEANRLDSRDVEGRVDP